MLIGQILRISKWSGHALAVLASAAVAWLVAAAPVPMPPVAMVAGAAQVTLMQDEHALIADYLDRKAEAERAAGLADARDRDEMRALAVTDAAEVPLPRPAKPIRLAAVAKTEVIPAAPPSEPAVAPIPSQRANTPPRPAPAARGARGVLATVERVPRWAWTAVQNAADWAIIWPSSEHRAPARTPLPVSLRPPRLDLKRLAAHLNDIKDRRGRL